MDRIENYIWSQNNLVISKSSEHYQHIAIPQRNLKSLVIFFISIIVHMMGLIFLFFVFINSEWSRVIIPRSLSSVPFWCKNLKKAKFGYFPSHYLYFFCFLTFWCPVPRVLMLPLSLCDYYTGSSSYHRAENLSCTIPTHPTLRTSVSCFIGFCFIVLHRC